MLARGGDREEDNPQMTRLAASLDRTLRLMRDEAVSNWRRTFCWTH